MNDGQFAGWILLPQTRQILRVPGVVAKRAVNNDVFAVL
jgi:hypothetical protein